MQKTLTSWKKKKKITSILCSKKLTSVYAKHYSTLDKMKPWIKINYLHKLTQVIKHLELRIQVIAELNSYPNQSDQRINMSVLLTKAGYQSSWAVTNPNFLLIKSKSGMHDCMPDSYCF